MQSVPRRVHALKMLSERLPVAGVGVKLDPLLRILCDGPEPSAHVDTWSLPFPERYADRL